MHGVMIGRPYEQNVQRYVYQYFMHTAITDI